MHASIVVYICKHTTKSSVCLLNLTNSTLTSCPALLVFCEPQVPKVLLAVPFLQSNFCCFCSWILLANCSDFFRCRDSCGTSGDSGFNMMIFDECPREHIFLCRWRCAPPELHRREAGSVYACNLCMQCHLCVQDANRARRRDEHIADCFPEREIHGSATALPTCICRRLLTHRRTV